jgi:hypothetical protein
MRNRLFVISAVATAALFALGTGSAGASGPAATYHGRFSQVSYDCGGSTWSDPADGTWNVAINSKGLATSTFNIFVDGTHHVAYGVPATPVTVTGSGWSFQFDTLAGTLVVSWNGATFRYDFPYGYSLNGLTCSRVTYSGS